MFVKERLVDGSKSIFSAIKKTKIKYEKTKNKRPPKEISILKEDRIAFGLIISKSMNLETAFKYPITSLPLAIADPDSTLRSSSKSSLRNYLIDESGASLKSAPKNCSWLIDGMAAVRTVGTKKTYKEWIKALVTFITPLDEVEPIQFGMINDVYIEGSTKNCTRSKRGESGGIVKVEGFEQHMQHGRSWHEFLCNAKNKTELLKLIGRFIKDEMKNQLSIPFIFTTEDRTYEMKNNIVEQIGTSNHEEADTRLILHAILTQTDTVIVCEDTDVLILMVWAYAKFNITKEWYMKYESTSYARIKDIVDYLGEEISQYLPHIHAITGCDTTSAFYRKGKVKVLTKVQENPSILSLIKNLGVQRTLDNDTIIFAEEFVRKVIYNGKAKEGYTQTRVRLYKTSISKSTLMLPPDQNSLLQAIKRVHHQVYTWLRSNETNIDGLRYQEFGWKWCQERQMIMPIWFEGVQISPEIKRNRRKEYVEDADDEGDEEEALHRNTKRSIHTKGKKVKKQKREDDDEQYDTGDETDETEDIRHTCEEENELCEIIFSSEESDWEVSDFISSSDSGDEWTQ